VIESDSEKQENKNPASDQLPRADLTEFEVHRGKLRGDTYVRVIRTDSHLLRRIAPGHLRATEEVSRRHGLMARGYGRLKVLLIGKALPTEAEINERLDKIRALAVFGADPISSCAYATEETLLVLMAAGNGALYISQYTAIAIALLLSMVAFSYRQTVFAYPHGGGSYNVSRENLGQTAGLVAAAALLIDYVLTVSVSIVAGAAAVSSALYASGFGQQLDAINAALPSNLNTSVLLSVAFIGLMTLGNLRGIRESGAIFAVPTYLFLVSLSVTLVVGFYQAVTGTLTPATAPAILPAAEPLTLWLIVRAFSAGAVAMSGTEAISNGVPAFKRPESKNAATTLTIMAAILGVFFLGVSQLATHLGLVPGNETIISQIARSVWGTNFVYYIFQIATMGILIVAGNTAFADFPRLSSVLARDHFMPHHFLFRGDRLAFSTGIVALGIISALLVVVFSGDVTSLIHLYAIGVFLAFSMSDSGMVVHWWRTRGPRWKTSILINGADAVLTSSIFIIVGVAKFVSGAWIVFILIPIIVLIFSAIHRHYHNVAEQLSLAHVAEDSFQPLRQIVLVPITDVNQASLRALAFARTISDHPLAIHVTYNAAESEHIRRKWARWNNRGELVLIESPYRSFLNPLLAYIDALHHKDPEAYVSVVLPEFLPAHWWQHLLHNQTAFRIKGALLARRNTVVIDVPYHLTK